MDVAVVTDTHRQASFLIALGFGLWMSALYGAQGTMCELGWQHVEIGPISLLRLVLMAIWVAHIAVLVPRSTVDWDTSQADDFRTRGGPWTIKRTRLERGRARRSEDKSLARWRSDAGAGCHASARVRQCCGYCAGKTWRPSHASWHHGSDADRLARGLPGRW
jgi:hypothetical protein